MNNGERTCIVCGKKYRYCGNCSDNNVKKETWRNIYCSDNCKKIFEILSAQANGHITDREAYSEISKLNTNNLDNFREDIKIQIKKITPITSYDGDVSQKNNGDKFFKPQNKKNIVKDKFD